MRYSFFVPVLASGFVASAALAGVVQIPLTTYTLGNSRLQYGSDAGGDPDWFDYSGITPNITAEGGLDGLHMYSPGEGSSTFQLGGSQYISESFSNRGNRLIISGTGTVNGSAWQDPDNFIRTTFGFGFSFGSGTLALYEVSNSFTFTDEEGNFIGGNGTTTGFENPFEPSGAGLGFSFENSFGDLTGATRFSWAVAFNFDWQGMDADDTLNWIITPNSVDFNTLPTPGAAALLGLGGLVAGRRRR